MVESLAGVPADGWNALVARAIPSPATSSCRALIDTGCASAPHAAGSRRSCCWKSDGKLAGAMPLFLKSHSYGEYVFDWAWADAYQRHGLRVLPEAAVRGAVHAGDRTAPARGRATPTARKLAAAALEMAREVSSLHVLFPPAAGSRAAAGPG